MGREAREAVPHLTRRKTTLPPPPLPKELSIPNVGSPKVEKPCSRFRKSWLQIWMKKGVLWKVTSEGDLIINF